MTPPAEPYPPQWEQAAELRVFRTTVEQWETLFSWRADMQRQGWRLLRVSSEGDEIVAVFGRTKAERASTPPEE
ncbi:MAG TPA: hypothetical protein VEK78_15710 [Gemmatimonadales bacterium]|nr:hypothetical protein [Gemmatimonadales bacterium]